MNLSPFSHTSRSRMSKRGKGRRWLFALLAVVLLLFGLSSWPVQAEEEPELDVITAVARQTRAAGSYAFVADITQFTVPAATPLNIGRSARQDELRLEGQTDLEKGELVMTLWSQGGNVLDAASGLEMKTENGRLLARQPGAEWQEISNFTNAFIPDGDFTTFLVGAENIVNAGTQTRQGLTFTRYTFDINGPAFAEHMRRILQQQMQQNGELPYNSQVTTPEQFAQMTGSGELWVLPNGLPLRQQVTLRFPEQEGFWIENRIDVTFSDFGAPPIAEQPGTILSAADLQRGLGALRALAWGLLGITAAIGLTILLFRRVHPYTVYRVITLASIFTMLANPLLQGEQAQAATARRQARQQQLEAAQAPAEDLETLRQQQAQEQADRLAQLGPDALARIRQDNGRDSDNDGLTDVQEYFLGSNPAVAEQDTLTQLGPELASLLSPQAAAADSDSDGDGLTDYEEALLGTNPNDPDTDDDLVSDLDEINGFSYNGRTWYTDPNDEDTNDDQLTDGQEWSGPAWDTDGDGTPDLFDRDNDGDNVPDYLDVSPFTKWDTVFNANSPFQLNVSGLTPGQPALVEFQLRPTNPDHLWYALNALDWPNDEKGNIVDVNGSTDDVRLLPMLEIDLASPGNLPLTAPRIDLKINGAPVLHGTPVSGTLTLTPGSGTNIAINADLSYTVNLLLREGTCTNLGPIKARADNVVFGNATFSGVNLWDVADGYYVIQASLYDDRLIYGCVPIPATPFNGYGGDMIDTAKLADYRISIRSAGGVYSLYKAYVPLRLITEDPAQIQDGSQSGTRVAFNGTMFYLPNGSQSLISDEVRLVWAVQAKTDICVAVDDNKKCTKYQYDTPQVVHVYEDSWTLTGLDVRQEFGTDLALIYEDPAVDTDLQDDLSLVMLADGLSDTFLAGRQTNGQRDMTVAEIGRRFDHPTNDNVSLKARWAISDVLRVDTSSYATLNEMIVASNQQSKNVLNNDFSPVWTASDPITPTIMYAYEWQFRVLNLDVEPLNNAVQWSGNGRQLTIDFNDTGAPPAQTIAALKWQPYAYDSAAGQWQTADMLQFWNVLERRYLADFQADPENADIAEGKLAAVQLFYLLLQNGIQQTVQLGNVIHTLEAKSDNTITSAFSKTLTVLKKAGPFITDRVVFGRLTTEAGKGFFKYLQIGLKQTLKDTINSVFENSLVKKLVKTLLFGSKLKRNLIIGGLIAAAVLIVGIILFAVIGTALQSKPAEATLKILMATLTVLLSIKTIYGVATSTGKAASGAGGVAAKAATTASKTAGKVASAIGLIIEIITIAIIFIVAVASGAAPVSSFKFELMLAYSIAALLVAALFFAINLIPLVGQIITAVIAIIDAILTLICELGVDELRGVINKQLNQCFTLSGAIVETLTWLFYDGGVIYDFDPNPYVSEDLMFPQLVDFDVAIIGPGLVAGSSINFQATVSGWLAPKKPREVAGEAFTPERIRTTGLVYSLTNNKGDNLTAPASNLQNAPWDIRPAVKMRIWNFGLHEFFLYKAAPPPQTIGSAPFTLSTPGINAHYMLPLYFNIGLSLPTYSCIFSSCSIKDPATGNSSNVLVDKENMVFDILPATLDEFYARNWGEWSVTPPGASAPISGGTDFQVTDVDGDGLLAVADGGIDPDDTNWDTDGDGLADGYEASYAALGLENGGGPISLTAKDTDGDGVCDLDELEWGTRPDLADTDGDGLTDGEERLHQDCATGNWTGGWTFTVSPTRTLTVYSDPRLADTDGDGMSDKTERLLHQLDPVSYPFNPNVYNNSPVGFLFTSSDADNVVRPGDSLVYTTTVYNNLVSPLWAVGETTSDFPAALGGDQTQNSFSLFQGSETAFATFLQASGNSQTVFVQNNVWAELLPAADSTPTGIPNFQIDEAVRFIIDNDLPASTLTGSGYVQADGFRIIGGTATDPTSYISQVEVQVVGQTGWETATGAEIWAYTWAVPATEGRYTIQTRATDAVGWQESPVNSQQVIVDGNYPIISTGQTGNPILPVGRDITYRWTLPLSGTAIDPAVGPDPGSGTATVEVLVEPLSTGWQTAVLDANGNWQIDYPLSRYDQDNQLVLQATGQYTVSVRATDNVGNISPDNGFIYNVRADNTPPQASLDSLTTQTVISGTTPTTIITTVGVITQNITLSGVITDPGAVSAGLRGLDIAFMPAPMLDSLGNADLLLYLNEPDGLTQFNDASGNDNHAVCAPADCPTGGVTGAFGTALQFNGGQVITSSADISETNLTIALWFNTTDLNSGLFMAGTGDLGSGGYDRALYLENGNLCAYVRGSINEEICSAGANYADGNWYQAVLVIKSGNPFALFVNGERVATASFVATSTLAGQTDVFLGLARDFQNGDAPLYLNGALDELAIYPEGYSDEQVTALYQRWQPVTLAASGPGITATTWTYQVPNGLDGFYQIDIRGEDELGNRNDDQRGLWPQWRGMIDTAAPRIQLTVAYTGSGTTAQTIYKITVEDFNLSPDNFAAPCALQPDDYRYDNSAWWLGISNNTPRLNRFEVECVVPGFQTDTVTAQACDLFGRCAVATADRFALYLNARWLAANAVSDIARAMLSDGSIQRIISDLDLVTGLALDAARGHIYWLERDANNFNLGRIHRADLDGRNPITLPNNINLIQVTFPATFDLAAAPAAGKLYWSAENQIFQANLDGSGETVLFTGPAEFRIGKITVDEINGRLFWAATDIAGGTPTATEGDSQIWRANLDGSNAQVIVDTTTLDNLVPVDLDYNEADGRLYWMQRGYLGNGDSGSLWRANPDGSGITNLSPANTVYYESGLSLTPDGRYVYWSQNNNVNLSALPNGTAYNFIQYDNFVFDLAIARLPGQQYDQPDLAVNVTADTNTVVPGDVFTYTLRVDNQSLLIANNVALQNTLPNGVSFVAANPAVCSGGGVLACNLGSIPGGGAYTLTLQLSVNAGTNGALTNTAVVASNMADADPADNTAVHNGVIAYPPPTPPAGDAYVYWGNYAQIGRASLTVPTDTNVIIDYPAIPWRVEGAAVDNQNGKIYWTVPSQGLIQRADLDGNNVETIFTDATARPTFLAIDPAGNALYWSDGGLMDTPVSIERVDLNGNGRTTIVSGIVYIKSLAIDTLHGYLYWSDGAMQLYRARLDGSNQESLLEGHVFFNLSVDAYDDKVYWFDPLSQSIERARLDGSNVETLLTTNTATARGLALDTFNRKLHWIENGTLYQANLNGSNPITLTTQLAGVNSFVTSRLVLGYSAPLPPPPTPTPTSTPTNTPLPTNTPTPTSTPTASPTPTNTPTPLPTPTPGGTPAAEALFFDVFSEIDAAPIAGCTDGSCAAAVIPGLAQAPAGMAVDDLNGKLYWLATDTLPLTFRRANLDGSAGEIIFSTSTLFPGGFTLDAENGFLYFTEGSDNIYRMTVNGQGLTRILNGVGVGRAITLDPVRGKLYWIDESNAPTMRIWRANLDGSNLELVAYEDGLGVPPSISDFITGIAFDPEREWLFWTDYVTASGTGRVRRANIGLGCATPGLPLPGDCLVTLYQATGFVPRGLAVDPATLQLYWGAEEGVTFSTQSMRLDGVGAPALHVGNLTNAPSNVALQRPVPAVCAIDGFEPDDDYTSATEIIPFQNSLGHNISTATDEDWLYFDAQSGATYLVRAEASGTAIDPYLELYDIDGTALLASDDNSGGGVDAQLLFTATANDRYYLRLTNVNTWYGCDTGYNLFLEVQSAPPPPPPPTPPPPPGFQPPLLDSTVLTPTNGTVLLNTNPVAVSGAAQATDYLNALTVTLNAAPFYSNSWPSGTLTETTWTQNWTPPGEGFYRFDSTAADWAGRVQTTTRPVTVTVDLNPPTVAVNSAVYTITHMAGLSHLPITGMADDSLQLALVEVSLDGGPWQPANFGGGVWDYPWLVASPADGVTVAVSARATDAAGRTATANGNITVDVVRPQIDLNTISLGYVTVSGTLPITAGQTIYQANPTLTIDWGAATDGSGIRAYRVGWTTSPTPTLSALTSYANAGTHSQTVGEAVILYAHVTAIDNYGNVATQTFGPFYIDGPATPDIIGDFNYTGWRGSGASQLGADREIANGPLGQQAIGVTQEFYLTWDDQALAMSWLGADWNQDGDLFIYLDADPGGATTLYNPFTTTAAITFPAGFVPEWLIWVQDGTTATLWNYGGSWTNSGTLTPAQYQLNPAARETNLYLPFSLLGLNNGSSLQLLAVASEEGTLRLWAASPDKNPLNSTRVVAPGAAGRDLSAYQLTLFDQWPSLALGQLPNEDRFTDSDVHIQVEAVQPATAVGYLNSDLLDLLTPGTPLDADGDGVVDNAALLGSQPPAPTGDGQPVQYRITYGNAGTQPANDVTVSLTALGALDLGGTTAVNLGSIAPGATGVVTVTGSIDTALNSQYAELDAAVSDREHGVYDWFWLHQPVDTDAPVNVQITAPLVYVVPFTQTVLGVAQDVAGIASVTLEAVPQPSGPTQMVTCTDPMPNDGVWSCAWNAGDLTGVTGFTLRARATDLFGQTSGWSAAVTLVVDDSAPTIALSAATTDALSDGFITANESLLDGVVTDDQQAAAAEVCQTNTPLDIPVCFTNSAQPGNAATGNWTYALFSTDVDGVTMTLRFTGLDGVGNRSQPITRTFRVDTVAPVITTTQLVFQSGGLLPPGTTVLEGTVTDGSGVAQVRIRVVMPDGSVVYDTAALQGNTWSYAPDFTELGQYTLYVEAWDVAGNARAEGPWTLSLVNNQIFLPIISYIEAPPTSIADVGAAYPPRSVTVTGETFYSTTLEIPAQLPSGGHFYFSGSPTSVTEILVDDGLFVLLNGVESFSYDFSADGSPTPAIVEIPRAVVETWAGQQIVVEYRDIYGFVVQADEIWLIWAP